MSSHRGIVLTLTLLLLVSTCHALPRKPAGPSLADQFLAPHNVARAAVRMPPLVWDPSLVGYARQWAFQRRRDCALRHSNGPYGENIFWGSGTGWSPGQAVAAWASERRWYDYKSNGCSRGQMCGHYTQIVWRSTKRVGCTVEVCSSGGGTFMVCEYDPPGNYIGERPY
ncbi:pathogenesis-related protein PR-1-like [Rhodamnia argentea]|uniref:Pathogenesis-related protein PR-1-like n=1 Tax=Rhodamnia argentea TaxID=178133 RepID=A0ABM3HC88_9MYRT|nr:pathogenesis-related protein PR-1-like [Rhodamnia argentea]